MSRGTHRGLHLDVEDKPFLGGSLERVCPSWYTPAPRGWNDDTQASLSLHGSCSYPLCDSGELQDGAHDLLIHTGEQLLPGGTQSDAAVHAHQSSTSGLRSLCALRWLCL